MPIRPLAVRACSGQQFMMQLDPSRYAAVATKELISKLPGLFHITLQSNVSSIVAHGLKPGHLTSNRGRVDVHFSPFPPHDRRNEMMRRKIHSITKGMGDWVVISVNPSLCPDGSLRFCLANNIVLSAVTIPSSAFDGIWTLSWSDSRQANQQWIYEPSLERMPVTHYKCDASADTSIAACLYPPRVNPSMYQSVLTACMESSTSRMHYYKLAAATAVREEDQQLHVVISLRR